MDRPRALVTNGSSQYVKLVEICEEYMEKVEAGCLEDRESQIQAFEYVMIMIYGEDVWTWINSKI